MYFFFLTTLVPLRQHATAVGDVIIARYKYYSREFIFFFFLSLFDNKII